MSEEQSGDLLTGGIPDGQPTEEVGNQSAEAGSEGSEATSVIDSSERPGWMDQLKGDLKDNESLRRFKSVDEAANSYVELEGKLGTAVTISEEPTAEELSRVRTLLGVPESAEGYDFTAIELPEGVTFNEEATERIAKFAKDNDYSQSQAQSLMKREANREYEARRQVMSVTKEKREQSELKLRQDLGGDYDKTLKAAKSLLELYGDEELTSELKDTGFGNSPALIRALGKAGIDISEGSAPRGLAPPRGEKSEAAYPEAVKMGNERNPHYMD